MYATRALCLLVAAGWLLLSALAAEDIAARDRVDAEASADPVAAGSFFDTFMAFLGSSALHQQQPADEVGDEAGEASESVQQQRAQPADQGRSLHGDLDAADGFLLAGAPPIQDGGQADRVKRTGPVSAQILSSVINKKLGYLGAKSSHHIHFHNYGGVKCDKPHFSLWEFKKAILHKLLEAAKAIGGGVLAIKGKLLTAKGHLVAAKGRKLATKGEELTEFGKSVLAKALGHGGHDEVVHSAPSEPSAPAAPYAAPVYGAPAFTGYQYAAPAAHQYHQHHQYPAPSGPSGHGYNAAVSLLNEYSRAGFGNSAKAPAIDTHAHEHAHAHAHAHGATVQHRTGMAPTGPSATGPAGTLPGNLQAGLLVLQPAPSAQAAAPHRLGSSVASASFQHAATVPAPATDANPKALVAPFPSVAASDSIMTLHMAESSVPRSPVRSQPLVLAPNVMDSMQADKVRRYAVFPSSRRSLDVAMASVVRRLQGADVQLHPDTREVMRTGAV